MINKKVIQIVFYFIFILFLSCNDTKTPVSSEDSYQFPEFIAAQSENFEFIRSLDEINTDDNAEAYPWISPDGLTLYFIKGNNSGSSLCVANRKSINDIFTNIQHVNLHSPHSKITSCWLTNNQLELYFTSMGYLFYAKRNSISENFGNSVKINLNVGNNPYFLGPSLTQDKSQLYIRNSANNNSIRIFSALNDTSFNLVDSLVIPPQYQPGIGQLSKDDLKYYISIDDEYRKKFIGYYTRNTTQEKFVTLYYFDNNINSGYKINILPSISADENILVYTRKNEPIWTHNNLFIAQKRKD